MTNDSAQAAFFAKELQDPENNRCFDCGKINPTWCSVNNGVYLCLACAGSHRGYGVHISFVRSLTLDVFEPNQFAMMRLGGNARAKAYFEEHPFDPPTYCVKWDCESADKYRRLLKRKTCDETGETYYENPPWQPTRRMEINSNRPVMGAGNIIPQQTHTQIRKKKCCCGLCVVV
uniref:Arf GTPase-activating protein, putative n=1 Tax=Entamoeba invadens TaxID=33085 RepID=S0B1V1_ENTIV|nr:arf GTPase-activating protein, putative [Entamoeba invadens]